MLRRSALMQVAVVLLSLSPALVAQRGRVARDPMTDKEIEEMREYRDQPEKRMRAMIRMIAARGIMLDQIRSDPKSVKPEERGPRIHDLLEDITNLTDEFDDNVDKFMKEQADIRKPLGEAIGMETQLQQKLRAVHDEFANKPELQDFQFQLQDAQESITQSLQSSREAIQEDEQIIKAAKEAAKKQQR